MQDNVDRGEGPGDELSPDRRRGPRRVGGASEFPADRRQDDRRSLLGWAGLLSDVADAPPIAESGPMLDRRKGPRRGPDAPADVQNERRGPDRRRRKPGLAALFGAIFGGRPTPPNEG
jgi:hypothetical protein